MVYDETEYFRKHDDIDFNYPYNSRKINAQSFDVKLAERGTDYNIQTANVKFEKTQVCL